MRDENIDLIFKQLQTPSSEAKGFSRPDKLQNQAYVMNLFNNQEVLQKLELAKHQRDSQELQVCLGKMQIKGGKSFLTPQPEGYGSILYRLLKKYPHFKHVIEFLMQRMRLNALREYPVLDFGASILLDGPAGCGKTSFLSDLSQSFETEFVSISCAASTNHFDLTGLSAGWGNGRAGKLHDLLVNMGCANPVCLLDEIDKTNQEGEKQNFTGGLYGLLEKNNAKTFQDEYIGVKMDASRINWFATSNDISRLDTPLRDRFEVISVEAPDDNHMAQIIPQIFKETVIEMGIQDIFATVLTKGVINKMLSYHGISIRRIQSTLKTGLANASIRVKKGDSIVLLNPSDIPDQDSSKTKQKIGFIA